MCFLREVAVIANVNQIPQVKQMEQIQDSPDLFGFHCKEIRTSARRFVSQNSSEQTRVKKRVAAEALRDTLGGCPYFQQENPFSYEVHSSAPSCSSWCCSDFNLRDLVVSCQGYKVRYDGIAVLWGIDSNFQHRNNRPEQHSEDASPLTSAKLQPMGDLESRLPKLDWASSTCIWARHKMSL